MTLLHHLARTGGTLISRCLASMQGVCLLSEINPLGTAYFNPLRQASQWYGLIRDDEVLDLVPGDFEGFHAAMELIRDRAQEQGLTLVVRDWAHADWVGFPFVSPPLSFSWDQVPAMEVSEASHERRDTITVCSPGLTLESVVVVADRIADPVAAIRCATVRHPVDQYLSCKGLGVLLRAWDEEAIWRGILRFSEAIQGMPWFRYEDFLAAPDETLKQICSALLISYDPSWRQRWAGYTRITGDAVNQQRNSIEPSERRPLAPEFWASLRGNEQFFETLDLLGYPVPEPLRRKCWTTSGRQQAGGEPIPERLPPPLRAVDWDGAVIQWRTKFETDPRDIVAGLSLARALRWIGQAGEAADVLLAIIPCCDVTATEAFIQLLSVACETLEKGERKFESIGLRRLWAQYDANHRDNLFQLSLLLAGVGEVDESLTYSRHLLTLDRQHAGAAANFLLYLNYSDRYSAAEVSNEHFRLGMRFTERPEPIGNRRPHPTGKLCVGYLSSDFYTHPVGKIILPILQSHDRERFYLNVYHDGKKSDANTLAIEQAVDRFTTIHGWSDQRVFEAIRGDEVDVLVDFGRVYRRGQPPTSARKACRTGTSVVLGLSQHFGDSNH